MCPQFPTTVFLKAWTIELYDLSKENRILFMRHVTEVLNLNSLRVSLSNLYS